MKNIDINRIRSIAGLQSFQEKVASTQIEDIFDLASPIEELVRQGFLLDLLHYELACIAGQRDYAPRDGTYNFLNLIFDEKFAYSLIMKDLKHPDRERPYANYPSDQIICPLNNDGLQYHLFRRSTDDPLNELNKQKKLEVLVQDHNLPYGKDCVCTASRMCWHSAQMTRSRLLRLF